MRPSVRPPRTPGSVYAATANPTNSPSDPDGAVRTASQAMVTVLIPSPSDEMPRPANNSRICGLASSWRYAPGNLMRGILSDSLTFMKWCGRDPAMALAAIAGMLCLRRLPQSNRVAVRILDRRDEQAAADIPHVLFKLAAGVEQLLQLRSDVADLPVRDWSAVAALGVEADLQVAGPEAGVVTTIGVRLDSQELLEQRLRLVHVLCRIDEQVHRLVHRISSFLSGGSFRLIHRISSFSFASGRFTSMSSTLGAVCCIRFFISDRFCRRRTRWQ